MYMNVCTVFIYIPIYVYNRILYNRRSMWEGSSKELMSWWADEENRESKNNIEQHRHWTQRLKNLMMRFFINLFINFNFLLNIIKYIENQQRHFFHLNSQHHRTLITLPTTVEQYWRRSWYNNKNSPKSFLVVYASNIKDNDPQVIIIICTYNVNIINNDKYAD